MFHENTNITREDRINAQFRQGKKPRPAFQGLVSKIAPPRAKDPSLRVGVFGCRTPHRPNPLGLSLARVVEIRGRKLLLSGLDLVDGTPVVDVKPYLPQFEAVVDAKTPDWVRESFSEQLLTVRWSPAAEAQLRDLLVDPKMCSPFFRDAEHFRRALEETLALDIRSPFQKKRHKNAVFTGDLRFHRCVVSYSLANDVTTILGLLEEAPSANEQTASCGEQVGSVGGDVLVEQVGQGLVASGSASPRSLVALASGAVANASGVASPGSAPNVYNAVGSAQPAPRPPPPPPAPQEAEVEDEEERTGGTDSRGERGDEKRAETDHAICGSTAGLTIPFSKGRNRKS